MVNKDQVAGVAKQVKGSVKQAAGKATSDRRTQAEGVADKTTGKVQKAYGDVKDKVKKSV
ncbi:CsbD family protein [Mesorhizobium sp. B2-5-4]|uniref:CsbD family protein n=1 Tax=unclassified Mesorhizobium TaxID=325217 RepID=UPI001125F6FB|nr:MULTISPECIES: CsbD family protein [unclassified Mesorhizobium]TPK38224.1 CsbD family protein [Mesorhizobium sp. B2-5-4]TPL80788.1 CsbD family protein [Mesorhizobium sp. B2-3-13]